MGEGEGALQYYDRNAPQCKSFGAMLIVMREREILDAAHRGFEWLSSLFAMPPQRLTLASDQSAVF